MKRLLIALAVLLPRLLIAQSAIEQIEARLTGATGGERLDLLLQLSTLRRGDDPAAALAFGDEAVDLARELGDPKATVEALRRVGEAQEALGDLENALGSFRRSLAVARQVDENWQIPVNLRHIGEIHRREGRLSVAAETLRRALVAATEIDAREEIRDVSFALAETYAALGLHQQAYGALRRYDEVRSELDGAADAPSADGPPTDESARRERAGSEESAGLPRPPSEQRPAAGAGSADLRRLAGLALAAGTAVLVLLVLALYSRQRLAARAGRRQADDRAELERSAAELQALEERSRQRIAELEASNAEARRRIAEQERYTTLISHDLKIPLIAIHGFLGLLQQDALAGDVARLRKDVERIQILVGKMAGLLDRLLELSRIGQDVESPQKVPLAELAREAVEMVTSQIANRRVEVAIDPDLPRVWGDRPRLLEVLQNLIANAVKFMGPQPAPRVEIGWETRAEPVYYVRDNGIGIEDRHFERVFGLFERLDQAKEGHGIGLALVERIIEAHGGRVWVESEGPGKGSMFCFTLARPENDSEWETRPGVEIRDGLRSPRPEA